MFQFTEPTKEDIPELIELWKSSFGEEEEKCAKIFFQYLDKVDIARVARHENKIISMSFGFSCKVLLPNTCRDAVYCYAGATLRGYRGLGINTGAMNAVVAGANRLNAKDIIVNCCDDSKRIFERKGFTPTIYSNLSFICFHGSDAMEITRCPVSDFLHLRSAFEKDNFPSISWPSWVLHYIYDDAVASGDVVWNEALGIYAIIDHADKEIRIRETNCHDDYMQGFSNSIMGCYDKKEIFVVTPPKKQYRCAKSTSHIYCAHILPADNDVIPEDLHMGFVT